MSVGFQILGPDGRPLVVDPSGAACVISLGFPPFGISNKTRWFRQFLTDDGLSSGSNDMGIDGSGGADFWVPAHVENDRYITGLSFKLVDLTATLDVFLGAAVGVLGTGCKLFYQADDNSEVVIHDALTTNLDVYRLCGQPAFGDGATALQIPNLGPPPSKFAGYLPYLDLAMRMPPWGIPLQNASKQRITLRLQDDLTAIDGDGEFNIIAYGFDRLP